MGFRGSFVEASGGVLVFGVLGIGFVHIFLVSQAWKRSLRSLTEQLGFVEC